MKRIISEFYAAARQVATRNPKEALKVMGIAYIGGDSIIALIPPFENGFARTVINFSPDWNLLASAYLDRPLPAIVSIAFVASGVAVAKGRYALAHGIMLTSGFAFMKDLLDHGRTFSALSFIPNIVGAAFGTCYLPLERKFGAAKNWLVQETLGKPKRVVGFCFAGANIPVLYAACVDKVVPLAIAAGLWLTGNMINMLLPNDTTADMPMPSTPHTPNKPQGFEVK